MHKLLFHCLLTAVAHNVIICTFYHPTFNNGIYQDIGKFLEKVHIIIINEGISKLPVDKTFALHGEGFTPLLHSHHGVTVM